MSSKILGGDQPGDAAPILWRTVSPAKDAKARSQADLEREAARKFDQARRDAFAEGLAAGRQQAEEQFRPAAQGLAQTLESLARLRETIREEATADLVHLALSIATRVIHREVAVDPDALAGLVKAAFTKIQSREISRVRMHPTLEGLVRKALEESGASKSLVLTADANLKPSEVLFETVQGTLDASVETQLREIERGLFDRLER
ncbi:MAG TPA: FliH/SctL family protein [Bryobacteraceae bacterium]|nr:FliH/SctL family protein [Bryobacteraceae bacterium]